MPDGGQSVEVTKIWSSCDRPLPPCPSCFSPLNICATTPNFHLISLARHAKPNCQSGVSICASQIYLGHGEASMCCVYLTTIPFASFGTYHRTLDAHTCANAMCAHTPSTARTRTRHLLPCLQDCHRGGGAEPQGSCAHCRLRLWGDDLLPWVRPLRSPPRKSPVDDADIVWARFVPSHVCVRVRQTLGSGCCLSRLGSRSRASVHWTSWTVEARHADAGALGIPCLQASLSLTVSCSFVHSRRSDGVLSFCASLTGQPDGSRDAGGARAAPPPAPPRAA
jgi:hypothetical protein